MRRSFLILAGVLALIAVTAAPAHAAEPTPPLSPTATAPAAAGQPSFALVAMPSAVAIDSAMVLRPALLARADSARQMVAPRADSVSAGVVHRVTAHAHPQRSTSMHDRNGHPVHVGDTVLIEARVTATYASPTHCNCTVVTTADMPGAGSPTTITLNTQQIEVTPVTWARRQELRRTAAAAAEQLGGELVPLDDPASPAVAAVIVPGETLGNPEE